MNTTQDVTRRHRATSARTTLAFAVAAALCAASACSVAGAAPTAPVSVAHVTQLRSTDAVIGALPLTQPIRISVALTMRDRAGLEAFVAQKAKDSARGVFSAPMTSEQFMASHAPTQAQVQAVVAYLSSKGFSNIQVLPNRMLVTAEGTAMSARDAFMTTLAQVRTGDGRIAWANTDEVRIPAALADKIRAVVGLQTVYIAHTFIKRGGRLVVHTNASNPVYPLHYTTDFPAVYGVGSAAAANLLVGIISEGDLTQTKANLAAFTTGQSLPAVTVQTFGTGSSDTSNTDEWSLDSQTIVGMTGGVSSLMFYKMPTMGNNDVVYNLTEVVSHNTAKIINVSLGECETGAHDGSAASGDDAFIIGAAQGQTFAISTGDKGADECSDGGITPSWPANSEYVVAVAGTTLTTTNSAPSVYTSESVWSGSGGSPSTLEPMPAWQQNFSDTIAGTTYTVPGSTAASPLRDVADVAFDADPATGAAFYFNGGVYSTGGTSLAAPIFAGSWARMLHVYPTIGFAGPVIYALPDAAFHDITSGNNGGETAGVNYDSASGRGSLIVGTAITDAAGLGDQDPVPNFSSVRTGQTFAFTDTSTATAPGNIATNTWDFGDGTTGSGATTSHYYATPGTYFVKETVKDSVGRSAHKGYSVNPAPVQEIKDPGFEGGSSAWTISPTSARINNPAQAHAGNWYVALGGVVDERHHHLQQKLILPAGGTSASLSFYVDITTAETTTTRGNDAMEAQVVDATTGEVLDFDLYSNLDATTGYVLKTMDLTRFLGWPDPLLLKFNATNNDTLPTTWAIDDVTVTVQ